MSKHSRQSPAAKIAGTFALLCVSILVGMGIGAALRSEKTVVVEKRTIVVMASPKIRATLAQVAKDWGITGRLDCRVVDIP